MGEIQVSILLPHLCIKWNIEVDGIAPLLFDFKSSLVFFPQIVLPVFSNPFSAQLSSYSNYKWKSEIIFLLPPLPGCLTISLQSYIWFLGYVISESS